MNGIIRKQRNIFRLNRLNRALNTDKEPIQLIFLRHGQSTWNYQNIFIGMTDTPLTDDGMKEAR